jgi:ribonuclease PH
MFLSCSGVRTEAENFERAALTGRNRCVYSPTSRATGSRRDGKEDAAKEEQVLILNNIPSSSRRLA